jgi:uncharacterized C2H2 Zn-finger protein
MPHSATLEDIKAHQENVEKNKITSEGLPPCPRCRQEPIFFKIHAYRERRFLLIIKAIITFVYCTLVRFRCPRCGKTFTHYPDFAMPRKHYTRQTIESFANAYVEEEKKTYETAAMTDDGLAAYPGSDTGRSLAGSTIYRWISTLAHLFNACRGETPVHPPEAAKQKFRTPARKATLLRCCYFLRLNPL